MLHRDVGGRERAARRRVPRDGDGTLVPFGAVNPMLPDWEDDLRRCREVSTCPACACTPTITATSSPTPRSHGMLELATATAARADRGVDGRRAHAAPARRVPPVDVEPAAGQCWGSSRTAKVILLNALRAPRGVRSACSRRRRTVSLRHRHLENVGGVRSCHRTVRRRLLYGSHAAVLLSRGGVADEETIAAAGRRAVKDPDANAEDARPEVITPMNHQDHLLPLCLVLSRWLIACAIRRPRFPRVLPNRTGRRRFRHVPLPRRLPHGPARRRAAGHRPGREAYDEDGRLYVVEMSDYPYIDASERQGRSQENTDRPADRQGPPADRHATATAGSTKSHRLRRQALAGRPASRAGRAACSSPRRPTSGTSRTPTATARPTCAGKVFTGFRKYNVQAVMNNLAVGPRPPDLRRRRRATAARSAAPTRPDAEPRRRSCAATSASTRPPSASSRSRAARRFGNTFDDWGNRFICDIRNPAQHVVLARPLPGAQPVPAGPQRRSTTSAEAGDAHAGVPDQPARAVARPAGHAAGRASRQGDARAASWSPRLLHLVQRRDGLPRRRLSRRVPRQRSSSARSPTT